MIVGSGSGAAVGRAADADLAGPLPCSSASFQDSSDLPHGLIQVLVDDHRVEAGGERLLGVGLRQPAGQCVGVGVGVGAGEQPLPLNLPGGRLHEDEERVRIGLAYGQGALDVELEQDVVSGGEVLLDRLAGRALQIVVDLERLEKPPAASSARNCSRLMNR